MVKTKIALIIDSLFISVITSLVLFIWLKQLIKNAIFVAILSIITLMLCFLFFFILLIKLNKTKITKLSNKKFLSNCINYLIFSNQKSYISYFEKLFNCNYLSNNIFVKSKTFLYINIKTTLTETDFLTATELYQNYKNESTKLIFIYRKKDNSFDEMLSLSNMNYKLISCEKLTNYIESLKIFPIEITETKQQKLISKIKKYIKLKTKGVSKKNFKEFFFSGLSLIFLSLISPFPFYYILIGSTFLIISIILLIKKDLTNSKNDFDFEK